MFSKENGVIINTSYYEIYCLTKIKAHDNDDDDGGDNDGDERKEAEIIGPKNTNNHKFLKSRCTIGGATEMELMDGNL